MVARKAYPYRDSWRRSHLHCPNHSSGHEEIKVVTVIIIVIIVFCGLDNQSMEELNMAIVIKQREV